MNDFSVSFSWPEDSLQWFSISYHTIDYWIGLRWASGRYASVNVRWPMGGGWLAERSPEILGCLCDIVIGNNRSAHTSKLSQKPVVIFHEHESPDEWETRLIFSGRKYQEIWVRVVKFVDGILKVDESITLCSSQMSLFERHTPTVESPVFVPNEELEKIRNLCASIAKVQKKYYQSEVDKLLSILPSS